MGATVPTLAYLVASVLFILALRGLSHPETSRQGNLYGMVGMAIAVVVAYHDIAVLPQSASALRNLPPTGSS